MTQTVQMEIFRDWQTQFPPTDWKHWMRWLRTNLPSSSSTLVRHMANDLAAEWRVSEAEAINIPSLCPLCEDNMEPYVEIKYGK